MNTVCGQAHDDESPFKYIQHKKRMPVDSQKRNGYEHQEKQYRGIDPVPMETALGFFRIDPFSFIVIIYIGKMITKRSKIHIHRVGFHHILFT
jgi:hypothetical protein